MRVQRDGRPFTVEVTADGEGLVSHAGSALLSQVADKTGLTGALSRGLTAMRERRSGHDPGRIVRDLAVMLADGGEALCDLGAIREQAPLFGEVASDATAYRVIERIAREPELLEGLRAARKKGRERAWELGVAPERVTIDLDATLIQSHSEKQGAAGNFKGGFGFHPMLAYFDESSEAAAGMLRSGNAGANTAVDQIAVAEAALEQISTERIESIEVLLRCDSAGASHELLGWAREGGIRFSVGLDLTETVREAILSLPERAWSPALDQDGSERDNGEAAEITELLDLSGWPERSRVIVRRERPHPGAQLSFTDHDGHRFQAILTDQEGDACELGVQRERPPREMRPDRLRVARKPPQPAAHRVLGHPQPLSDRPMPRPGRPRRQRSADHRHGIPTAQQTQLRQQDVRPAAPAALRPPRPQPPETPNHALPRMPPRPQFSPAAGALQRPADQLGFDHRLLGAYHHHRVPPPASKRALPAEPTKLAGGLSRVYERAKPANPASPIPVINSSAVPAIGCAAAMPVVNCAKPLPRAELQLRSTDAPPTIATELVIMHLRGQMN